MHEKKSEITSILRRRTGAAGISRGDADRLFAAAYDELRAMAESQMRRERTEHTLQPTSLIHEAYVRLVDGDTIDWQSRAHFFGIAGRAMRQVLVDHARRRGAAKRGGDYQRVTLHEERLPVADPAIDALDLEDALSKLGRVHPRMAQVVELRVFGGLTGAEIASELGVSHRTVTGDWRVATLWLRSELEGRGT